MRLRYILSLVILIGHATWLMAQGHPGLNVVILGDSNTFIGGEECDRPQGWSRWFREAFRPATCRSYARSGATWTNTASTRVAPSEYSELLGDNNVIMNQVVRLREAVKSGVQPVPQIVMIMAGTNDAWFEKARPGIFDLTPDEVFRDDSLGTGKEADREADKEPGMVTSLAGSVRYCCEMVTEAMGEAQIILITPTLTTKASKGLIMKVGDTIEGCGSRMSHHVIRLDKDSGIDPAREGRRDAHTSDGVHTNVRGARKIGRLIARRLNDLWLMN